jgi:chemotaxis protein CheX
MAVEISSAELTAIVDEIFGAMAGMQLLPRSQPATCDTQCAYVVSAVQIVGQWQGAVQLDIDMGLARRTCANLTGVDPAELSQDDVRDTAGELANMVGGSVKALVANSSRLSLPTVTIGRDFEFTFSLGTLVQSLSFVHQCGGLKVSVIERQERAQRPVLSC